MAGWKDGWKEARMGRWMDGSMDGRTNGWTDGWMDETMLWFGPSTLATLALLRHSTTCVSVVFVGPIWEFPKILGTLFWGPYNKDPTI